MQGSCLCGAVKYRITGTPRSIVACHCNQCRKSTGHYVAATRISTDDFSLTGENHIKWYQSSKKAWRGFCKICGSNLFWQQNDSGMISVFAGSIDGPTGLKMDRQLYPENKGDYYALPDVNSVDQSSLYRGAAGAKQTT